MTFALFNCWRLFAQKESMLFFEPALIHCNPKRIKTLRSSFLGIGSNYSEFVLYPLQEHLKAQICPVKPTSSKKTRLIAFKLKDRNSIIELKENQEAFLGLDANGLFFSENPTKFGFTCRILDENTVEIHIQINLDEFPSEEIKITGKKVFFLQSENLSEIDDSILLSPWYQKFLENIWLGEDLILKKLSFEPNRPRIRLAQEVYPVKPGALFAYSKSWNIHSQKSILEETPLIQINDVTSKYMEGYVWKPNEYRPRLIKMEKRSSVEQLNKNLKEFIPLRLRGKNKILFSLQNHRLIAKENDWVVYFKNKWQINTDREVLKMCSQKEKFPCFYIKGLLPGLQGTVEIEYYDEDHANCLSGKIPMQEKMILRAPKKRSKAQLSDKE